MRQISWREVRVTRGDPPFMILNIRWRRREQLAPKKKRTRKGDARRRRKTTRGITPRMWPAFEEGRRKLLVSFVNRKLRAKVVLERHRERDTKIAPQDL